MEVYIVTFIVTYESETVYGVFSTEEKAKAYILNSKRCDEGKGYGFFEIQQITVDAIDPDLSNSYRFEVSNKE